MFNWFRDRSLEVRCDLFVTCTGWQEYILLYRQPLKYVFYIIHNDALNCIVYLFKIYAWFCFLHLRWAIIDSLPFFINNYFVVFNNNEVGKTSFYIMIANECFYKHDKYNIRSPMYSP